MITTGACRQLVIQGKKQYWANFTNGEGVRVVEYETPGVKVDHGKAFAVATNDAGAQAINSATTGNLARVYKVQWKDDPVPLWHRDGSGVAYSKFCASCHTDYMASSGSKTGSEGNPKYYRHTTNNNSYTCARCHYAHGTDVTIMIDASGHTIWSLNAMPQAEFLSYVNRTSLGENETQLAAATSFMLDRNESSALKKFTNMSSCWACHNSSKAVELKNVDYEKFRQRGTPSGMPTGR
ncbi:MAG: hypothetical protein LRY73_19315 [Bacillus sp. (in: Bacteria)]|nr:hypothetical protein [Bacillus sp. (in: firmicutes)]